MAGDEEASTAGRVSVAVPARRGYAISRTEAPTGAANPPLHAGDGPRSNRGSGGGGGGGGGGYKPASGKSQQQYKNDSERGGGDRSKGGGRGRRKRGGRGASGPAASGAETRSTRGRVNELPRTAGARAGEEAALNQQRSPRPANAPLSRQQSPRVHQHAARDEGGFGRAPHKISTKSSGRQYYHEHDDRSAVVAPVPSAAGRTADRRPDLNSENAVHASKPRADTRGKPYSVRGRGGDSGNSSSSGGILSRLGPPPGSPRNALTRGGEGGGGGGHDDRHVRGQGGTHRSQQATGARSSHAGHQHHDHVLGPSPHPSRAPEAATATAAAAVVATGNSKGQRHAQQQSKHETASHCAATGGRGINTRGGDVGRGKVEVNRPPEASRARGNAATSDPKACDNAKHQRQQKQGRRPHQPQHQPQQQHQRREQQQEQEQGDYARGMCMTMCPESEMREREAEGGLSPFEATEATADTSVPFRDRIADPNKAVKKYRRSAAGRNMQSPQQLRPLAVLQTTARYLVKDVFARACSGGGGGGGGGCEQGGHAPPSSGPLSVAKAYAFVEDRLRAVRQDLTVQGLVLAASAGAAEVLKTAANFYIVAGYLMSDEASDVFDRHLHTRELQGVFSSLAELFFQARGAIVTSQPCRALGADEYLCLQAVHALATAITNGFKGGETQLGVAADSQGVGRLVTITVSKLCSSSIGRANQSGRDGTSISATAAVTAAGAGVGNGGLVLDVAAPLSESFRNTFPKMAMAVRLLGVVGAGNWSEIFRMLGIDSVTPEGGGGGGDGCGSGSENGLRLVGGEVTSSPFAMRIRCLCHGMLLPVRAHALRAMNMAYGKNEKVPLADVARMLRARDEDHAAGICRALSLPIEETWTQKGSEGSQAGEGETQAQAGRKERSIAVVFKSVPAVWKSDKAMAEGYCRGDASAPQQHPRGLQPAVGSSARSGAQDEVESGTLRNISREDDLVGLTRALAATVPDKTNEMEKQEGSQATTVTCDACAGFGCSWCDNGVVKAEKRVGGGEEEEEGLWEVALCPT